MVTVYRILSHFTDLGITETARAEDGQTLYRLRTTSQHRLRDTDLAHHIDFCGTCLQCT